MTMKRRLGPLFAAPLVLSALCLSACNDDDVPAPQVALNDQRAPQAAAPALNPVRVSHPELRGHVVGIEPVTAQDSPSGAGAAVGGVLGGVLGHQVGGGSGRTAATVVGAVGGAVLGNNIEKHRSTHIVGYTVSVRTDNGKLRSFQRNNVNDLSVGANVRIVGGGVQPA
jgi:outer membrane lipoprotein SlyB